MVRALLLPCSIYSKAFLIPQLSGVLFLESKIWIVICMFQSSVGVLMAKPRSNTCQVTQWSVPHFKNYQLPTATSRGILWQSYHPFFICLTKIETSILRHKVLSNNLWFGMKWLSYFLGGNQRIQPTVPVRKEWGFKSVCHRVFQ